MYTTELWEYGVENVGRAKIEETNGRTSVSLSARSFTLFHACLSSQMCSRLSLFGLALTVKPLRVNWAVYVVGRP